MRVWVTESRPVWRVPGWPPGSCANLDIDHQVLADAAVGALLEREQIDAVLLAGDSDRRQRGRRAVSSAAAWSRAWQPRPGGGPVPVFVAAPIATFDPATPDGAAIPVEDAAWPRSPDLRDRHAPRHGRVRWNRGNDVCPPAWVHRVVTEWACSSPPTRTA